MLHLQELAFKQSRNNDRAMLWFPLLAAVSICLPTNVFISRIQWKVSIWAKVEMSMGKLRFGNTTPNIAL